MAVKIIYSESAKIDIHKAKCFFDIKEKGELFLDELFRLEGYIQAMPEMFQIKYRNIRIANMDGFRYAIHYITNQETVFIYRVFPQGMEYYF